MRLHYRPLIISARFSVAYFAVVFVGFHGYFDFSPTTLTSDRVYCCVVFGHGQHSRVWPSSTNSVEQTTNLSVPFPLHIDTLFVVVVVVVFLFFFSFLYSGLDLVGNNRFHSNMLYMVVFKIKLVLSACPQSRIIALSTIEILI